MAKCPFEKSAQFAGLTFAGKQANYTHADTWYPSWASDGNLYSPFTDGSVNDIRVMSVGDNPSTGAARITGDDPLQLSVEVIDVCPGDPAPYGGRYPCGSLLHNGVWYFGTYCLMNENGSLEGFTETEIGTVNWGVLGPFVGFRTSMDFGRTWIHTRCTPSAPLFPEPENVGGSVRLGAPHFVDFGQNMQNSPDGKAYLIGHGAIIPDPEPRIANASWITGDAVYMARFTPDPGKVDNLSVYEFFAGHDGAGQALWTSDFNQIRPLLAWNNHLGCVTVTYNAPLRKYLMCVTDGGTTVSTYDTYILEADSLTGPWRLIKELLRFGPQAYFVNIPSKFISADGTRFWLCYSANFWCDLPSDPPGSGYAMCLQEVQLLEK
jgi:hypothetical protein